MHRRKFVVLLSTLAVVAAMVGQVAGTSSAAPGSPTDETKVPHYFGPYPNWANSPFTQADAKVAITVAAGCFDGGATAVATVGMNGGVTGITVTDPGNGYAATGKCLPVVTITGSGTGATAKPTVTKSGAVVAVTVNAGGTEYKNPKVGFSGGGGTGATATAYGGVSSVHLLNGGSGYTYPTVQFDLPDHPNGVQATGHAECDGGANCGATGTITAVIVDSPGSGYSMAPDVAVLNGTQFDPIPLNPGGALATFDPPVTNNQGETINMATGLTLSAIEMDTFGAGYNNAPSVTIADPVPSGGGGSGALATAVIDEGAITAITVTSPGSGYITPGGIRKFVDTLPGLGSGAANNLGQYIPVAVPDTATFPAADYYVIGLVQTREKMHSDLPATLTREYVQLKLLAPGQTCAGVGGVLLETANLGGGTVPTLMPDGSQACGYDKPHWLGPTIVATKDKPVRITFYNLLPKGVEGDLFLPTDTTIMGSGPAGHNDAYDPAPKPGGSVTDGVRNPMCTEDRGMMDDHCFRKNRATLHLHGGNTPWISDGTPHQWITPAQDTQSWPQGVSVQSVPDMVGAGKPANVPDCSGNNDGCMTFYYTNQQSARLMFYHDHAWGITRLNVYAGEAAAYVITDDTEKALLNKGLIPNGNSTIPLVIQDRTFVPRDNQLYDQDPTWDASRWGSYGNFWYHHVYMPAQNPGDPSGMSGFGRWMYGPWFWPPAKDTQNGPILNPYYNMDPATGFTTPLATPCSLDDPATWQYQEDPFCEPEYIPGTPNISAGMEQFNDTPIVNGTAYPTLTVKPKPYRLRILNAANDRFWNLQWYVADATGTEVALKADQVAAAQLDPVVFPTPDLTKSPAGPDWIQIGTEGGFLPHPVVVDGQQVTTWITDPTRFDVGNVDLHSMLVAPAERADTIVDFSKFAGKTLILYNDAPAAFPARIPSYDYYTGAPDLSPVGAPTTLPGYGPNTRTIMQVKVDTGTKTAFNLKALKTAFAHKANGSGVFESGQPPIIVGQAQYNSAYGTSFAASGNCTAPANNPPTRKCDGFARINQQGGDTFWFDTLKGATSNWAKMGIPLEPKAIHDETNASNFDEFGRMQANLGVEVVPATPGLQNVVLHPYVFSPTEVIDTTNLPRADVKVTPISTQDGTQIWKITHNGVDTHPIHFHAYDVQILNRVTWDNIIIPPDETELGWKDTIRVSPLEDTIVALRPITPKLPFDFPNAVRLLSPMMADRAEIMLATKDQAANVGMKAFAPNGEPIDVYNHLINLGAEYVYHCHILSHEEMDMMRPVLLAYPPVAPTVGLANNGDGTGTLSWTDVSLSETEFIVQRWDVATTKWVNVETIPRLFDMRGSGPASQAGLKFPSLLPSANTTGDPLTSLPVPWESGARYRVVAQNTVGDSWDYTDPNLNGITQAQSAFPVATPRAFSNEVVMTP